jgi:hypothetical protein
MNPLPPESLWYTIDLYEVHGEGGNIHGNFVETIGRLADKDVADAALLAARKKYPDKVFHVQGGPATGFIYSRT